MPSYSESRTLPYTPKQLFDLVADVACYPEFLPWCRAARLISHEADSFLAELVVSFNHLTERYTSRVTPTPPSHENEGKIEVALVHGPFKHLNNQWRFVPCPAGTELHFSVDFEFKSKLLNSLMGNMFTRASEKMMDAFLTRAQQLYP